MKYVLFTGATGGLGSVCVQGLTDRGYTVFAAGTNGDRLAQLGGLPRAIPLHLDVTDMRSVEAARDTVLQYTQRLHAIVNFAGLSAFCSLVEGESVGLTERLLDVNVMGMVRVNRTFFDLVLAGGGRIINCSSEAGWMTSQPFAGPYFLSKHAVEAYSDSLRRELLCLGVPVVKLQPGSYKTSLTDGVTAQFDKTLAQTQYYQTVLTRMKPFLAGELERANDPAKLARTLIRAIEAKRPKLQYRVGTGKTLALMELLPDGALDLIYKMMFR